MRLRKAVLFTLKFGNVYVIKELNGYEFFNSTFKTNNLSHERRKNTFVSDKNKVDIQTYTSYHRIKLMSYPMKL